MKTRFWGVQGLLSNLSQIPELNDYILRSSRELQNIVKDRPVKKTLIISSIKNEDGKQK